MIAVNKAREFVSDVATEMKKSTWPAREELMESTAVVIVSLALLGGFVFLSDLLLMTVIQFVF